MLFVVRFPHLGPTSDGVAPLLPCFRNVLDETVKTIALVPRVNNFSIETTIAYCRFRQARATFTTAVGKVAESARYCPLAFTLFCHDVHGLKESFSLILCHFGIVSCSRVCLLVVSRLLALTLRPSAPVCSCHRHSLTRGRLAIVQEAVRVFFFSVFSIGSARGDMCPVVSGSLREMSLQAVLKNEGPAALV